MKDDRSVDFNIMSWVIFKVPETHGFLKRKTSYHSAFDKEFCKLHEFLEVLRKLRYYYIADYDYVTI